MGDLKKQLPKGWAEATLSEVIFLRNDKIDPLTIESKPYVSLEHIESGSNRIIGQGKSEDVKSLKSVFLSGDILYGKLRPYLNKVCQPQFDGVCSTDILVFGPSRSIDNRFLMGLLSKRETVEYANRHSKGINLPRVSPRQLGELKIQLPPLNEQKRIVAKIGELQARSRRAREALENIPNLLEQLRQSILSAAFRGDLTKEWRKKNRGSIESASELLKRIHTERRKRWEAAELEKLKAKGLTGDKLNEVFAKQRKKYKEPVPVDISDLPELPEAWCWASLSELSSAVKTISYGVLQPGDESRDGTKLVRVCDLGNGGIKAEQLRTISSYVDAQYERTRLHGGELLVSVVGTIGRLAIVPYELLGTNIARAIARIIPLESINAYWLLNMLSSPFLQDWLVRGAREVARKTLNVAVLEKAPIPLASDKEMQEILNKIKSHLSFKTPTIEAVNDAKNNLDQFDQSIHSKAFRGELVPQDPNDEPASVLLESIKKQKELEVLIIKTRQRQRS